MFVATFNLINHHNGTEQAQSGKKKEKKEQLYKIREKQLRNRMILPSLFRINGDAFDGNKIDDTFNDTQWN